MKLIIIFVLLFLSTFCIAQIRMDKLEVKAGESFEIKGTDILVVDTLVMQDSSTIILNREKIDNFIHAKVIRIGKDCTIIGKGANGTDGASGYGGYTAEGPCKDGVAGRNGTAGTTSQNGVNLFIYFNQLTIAGKFFLELSGGNGGDGGRGGNGGGGSPGTRLCSGGNGGNGGNGAKGGNGGNGGNLTLTCPNCTDLRILLGNKIMVRTYGGNGGLGGEGGHAGLAGLVSAGQSSQDGNLGTKGKTGESGVRGKDGAINFEEP